MILAVACPLLALGCSRVAVAGAECGMALTSVGFRGRGRRQRTSTGVRAVAGRRTQCGEDCPDLAGSDPEVAFARLFDTYAVALRGYLAGRVGTHAADDLVAETFLLALRKRGEYDPERGPVRAWLFGIATNLLRNHVRQETRRFRATARAAANDNGIVDGPELRATQRLDAQNAVRELAGALAGLNRIDRDVLLLVSWAGLEPGEVARALGLPASTVRSKLHRVRHRLRGLLSRETGREGKRDE